MKFFIQFFFILFQVPMYTVVRLSESDFLNSESLTFVNKTDIHINFGNIHKSK